MKKLIVVITMLLGAYFSFAQGNATITSDIDHFWEAYDSTQTTKDSLLQVNYIQRLYVDRGTPGLRAFMRLRNYTAAGWVVLIRSYPKFWKSVRPNTESVKLSTDVIEKSVAHFRQLYPSLKPARMYFTVGALRSGGTTTDSMVLIGTEIATANAQTDASEFPNNWLRNVFKEQKSDNFIPLNIHEYVHTQQNNGNTRNLLGQAIMEGSCDFITELVIERPMRTNYINYGLAHEAEVKEGFKTDMFSPGFSRWLYNGSSSKTMADLGYFMGYRIAKAYYEQAADKPKAIKEIIELNYADTTAVEKFLQQSKYYPEGYDKQALIAAAKAKKPVVVSISPLNGADLVDTTVKEITIYFSKPMAPGISIQFGKGGRATYPIMAVKGYSEDKKSLVLKVDLHSGRKYEFILSGNSFASEDGYAIEVYPVSFTTK